MQSARKPRIRPARAVPRPPARPSVRSTFRRARRARTSAAAPKRTEPQDAAVAWTSVTWSSLRAAAKAATGSASPSSAQRTDPRAASFRAWALLLLVRTSNGGWRDRTADHACHGDQRQDVGERLEERRCGTRVHREPEGQRRGEAEQERRPERPERAPVAEDERRERDEAPPGGHVLVEGANEADRQERATQRCQHARGHDARVAHGIDVDADRVGGTRMLTARADAQSDRRLEHDNVREWDERDRDPDQQVEAAEGGPDERLVLHPRDIHVRDPRDVRGDVAAVVE